MGRPRVRNRILEAARVLLEKDGALGLTTRAVATQAGVTEASLFNNFGDKAGLLQALISEAIPEQGILLDRISDNDAPFDQWLLSIFTSAAAYFEKVLPITAPSLTGNPVRFSHDQACGFFKPRQLLTKKLAEYQTQNRIPSTVVPELTSLMLMGAAMHTAVTRVALGTNTLSDSFTGKQLMLSLGLVTQEKLQDRNNR